MPAQTSSTSTKTTRLRWFKQRGVSALALAAGLSGLALAQESVGHWDKNFLTSAVELDYTEIRGCDLALKKSTDPDVRDYAQKIIDAHHAMSEELKQLAAKKNVVIPTEPSLLQRGKLEILNRFNTLSFDKNYASMIGVAVHQDLIELFEKTKTKSRDADIKQFAASQLPVLQSHLADGNELKGKVETRYRTRD